MQAQILQVCEAPSDLQTNNKLDELERQSPLHLGKATLNSKNSWETNPRGFWQRNQTLGASEFRNPRNRDTLVLLGQVGKT
jgi:hypothetical protein